MGEQRGRGPYLQICPYCLPIPTCQISGLYDIPFLSYSRFNPQPIGDRSGRGPEFL